MMTIKELDEKCKQTNRRLVIHYQTGVCKGLVKDAN